MVNNDLVATFFSRFMTHIHVLGIGMGLHHVTRDVASIIPTLDYVVASEKETENGRLLLRRSIVEAYPGPHGPVPIMTVPDPPHQSLTVSYRTQDWHQERARRHSHLLRSRPGRVGFLVWGDPSLHDSTIRLIHDIQALGLDITYDVSPGISAPQLLAARHKIMLHHNRQPVHITTGDDLQRAVSHANSAIVAVLNRPLDSYDLGGLDEWMVYWGANLGGSGEQLAHGRLDDVLTEILQRRSYAYQHDGWVLDIALFQAPHSKHL